jgi:hypothetical protein
MRAHALLLALGGGGTAWIVHLSAAYALVALGCPRGWPGLGWLLAGLTLACVSAAVAVGVFAVRRRREARPPQRTGAATEARGLLFAVGALLAGLFALAMLGGAMAALALPPCQGGAIGGGA